VGHGRDEAEAAAGFLHAHVAGRAAGAVVEIRQRIARREAGPHERERQELVDALPVDLAERHDLDQGQVHAPAMGPFQQRLDFLLVHALERDRVDLDGKAGFQCCVDAGKHLGQVAPARDLPELCGIEGVERDVDAPHSGGLEIFGEAAYLKYRNGNGAVSLLAEHPESRAIMIERALPGESLTEHFREREPECIEPAIDVLRTILRPVPADLVFVIMLDDWFDGLRRYPGTNFPKDYATKALNIYEKLSKQRGRVYYLHGDFHPANIVTATRSPFLAIDPKGLIGHLGYEIAVFLNNFHWWQETKVDVRERLASAVEKFAAAFDIDSVELRQWAFTQMVLGAWWTFDEMPEIYDNEVAKADIWNV